MLEIKRATPEPRFTSAAKPFAANASAPTPLSKWRCGREAALRTATAR